MRNALLLMGAALLAASVPGTTTQRVQLLGQRSSPQDLQVSGELPGVPAGQTRFIRYVDLSRLAQVSH
ncbi:MAG TPA: hypothetical protein VHE33_17500, partial [Acidobacteriaceae bacterium]|nr:hypothetical protein [Acidobacteriaceae bacterium]